jgi:hypothetical protein
MTNGPTERISATPSTSTLLAKRYMTLQCRPSSMPSHPFVTRHVNRVRCQLPCSRTRLSRTRYAQGLALRGLAVLGDSPITHSPCSGTRTSQTHHTFVASTLVRRIEYNPLLHRLWSTVSSIIFRHVDSGPPCRVQSSALSTLVHRIEYNHPPRRLRFAAIPHHVNSGLLH